MAAQRELRILVADDDLTTRIAVQKMVERAPGLELVAACRDGVEALGALREHRPDVAVLDHLMPGMDGVQVAARARDEHLGTVVVLLSAALDGVSMVDLRRAGVTAWLEKGIAPRQFGDAIRGAVARAAPAVTSP